MKSQTLCHHQVSRERWWQNAWEGQNHYNLWQNFGHTECRAENRTAAKAKSKKHTMITTEIERATETTCKSKNRKWSTMQEAQQTA